MWAEHLQTTFAAATLPATVMFIVLYLRDPWYRGPFGWSLMILAVGVFLYSSAVVLFRLFGDYPGRSVLIVAAQGLTFLAMLIRTAVLWHAQRDDRQDASRENAPRP